MKRLVVPLIVAAGVAAFAWQRYAASDPELRDPERAVRTLLDELTQISALAWDSRKQERAGAALEAAKADPGRGIPEEVQPLARGIGRFFADPGIGKGVLTLFLITSVESFTLEPRSQEGAFVRVPVSFSPKDVLGIRGMMGSAGVSPAANPPPKQQRLEFLLQEQGGRWRIVDVQGELGEIIRRFRGRG